MRNFSIRFAAILFWNVLKSESDIFSNFRFTLFATILSNNMNSRFFSCSWNELSSTENRISIDLLLNYCAYYFNLRNTIFLLFTFGYFKVCCYWTPWSVSFNGCIVIILIHCVFLNTLFQSCIIIPLLTLTASQPICFKHLLLNIF